MKKVLILITLYFFVFQILYAQSISESLGGISRFTFQMDNAALPHEKLLSSIKLIGEKVQPFVKKGLIL